MSDFRYYLRVRYGECDAQKVVFNARWGDYVDIAMGEFMRALGYGAEMASGEIDFQLVKQTTEWRAPARFDQVLEATVRAGRLGNTSVSLLTEFRIAGKAEVIVVTETVYVLVDAKLSKRVLPDELRERLQCGAPGVVVDHAGASLGRSARGD
jgi:acyl-CoA thioester hydrolase